MKNKVKFLRKSEEHDLTQQELADKLGVSLSTVRRIERNGEINGSLMLKISHFFNRDAREIFELEAKDEEAGK